MKRMNRRRRRQVIDPRIRAEVIATWGNECWLRLPGCTGVGEEDDHIVPWSHRGMDSVANIRRACKHCNSVRQDRVLSGYGATIHCVIGPPTADLIGYATERMALDSVMVAHSEFARVLSCDDDELAATKPVRLAAAMAWDAAYRQLARTASPLDVWLIRTLPRSRSHPDMLAEWIAFDYDIHVVDPGSAQVFDTVGNATDEQVARQWYAMGVTQATVRARLAQRRRQLVRLGLRNETIADSLAW